MGFAMEGFAKRWQTPRLITTLYAPATSIRAGECFANFSGARVALPGNAAINWPPTLHRLLVKYILELSQKEDWRESGLGGKGDDLLFSEAPLARHGQKPGEKLAVPFPRPLAGNLGGGRKTSLLKQRASL
jgi:hypothetical protein